MTNSQRIDGHSAAGIAAKVSLSAADICNVKMASPFRPRSSIAKSGRFAMRQPFCGFQPRLPTRMAARPARAHGLHRHLRRSCMTPAARISVHEPDRGNRATNTTGCREAWLRGASPTRQGSARNPPSAASLPRFNSWSTSQCACCCLCWFFRQCLQGLPPAMRRRRRIRPRKTRHLRRTPRLHRPNRMRHRHNGR